MTREILYSYQDPLDLIWLDAARRVGMRVVRSDEVHAWWDGAGTLSLSTPEGFDPDDSLAQLIFHEICHALLEGPAAFHLPDWGLDNLTDRDLWREDACHRLQAALTARHGLRDFLAPTTDFRPYWDALPEDPLAPGDDPAIPVAREAWERARHGPWAEVLEDALAATRRVADAARPFAPPGSLWARTLPLHPTGFPVGGGESCGTCGWRYATRRGAPQRCRQARPPGGGPGPLVDPAWRACDRWEPVLDASSCESCGACCRGGYDLVPVGLRAPLARSHPELIARDAHGAHLARPGGLCVALDAEAAPRGRWRCRVYDERPRSCKDFAVGGDHCLEARRRVGLSRSGDPVRP
ncbi:YkgJ family cysteine cluster protein [Myxococcota bacterium]|nr:YkgJ family cysteine cluster protein [Myxococcota bacterium]